MIRQTLPLFLSSLLLSCGGSDAPPIDPNKDITPPSFGGALTATTAPTAITVSWKPAVDDVSAAATIVYQVFVATKSGSEDYTMPVATTQPGATDYTVTGLDPTTKYYFVVRARDEAGNLELNRSEVSAMIRPPPDVTAPRFYGLNNVVANGSSIQLTWQAATDDVTKPANMVYLVYQSLTNGGENLTTPTYTTNPGVTRYTVTGLKPSTYYYFIVRARDEAGNTDSNTSEGYDRTGSPSLATDVQPIIDANCATGTCHTGATPAAGLDLSTAALTRALASRYSGQCGAVRQIYPGDPTQSYFMWKLAGKAPTGAPCYKGVAMPKGQAALSAADQATVAGWIAGGAPNN
jgi:hypothetical protein